MQIGRLTDNQFYVLDAVAADFGRAYLASIRKYIEDQYGKDMSFGRQADILGKFEQAGWVNSRWSAPGQSRGQRRKKLYTITGLGEAVLTTERAGRHAIFAARSGLLGGVV